MLDPAVRARALPFAVYIAFIALADLLQRAGCAPQQLRWLYGVKIAAVLAVLWQQRAHYSELTWRPVGGRMLALAVAGGVLVLVLWIRLDAGWMRLGSSAGFDPRRDGAIDWTLVALRIAGAALVVPVMEELFWRSLLMRWIEQPRFLTLDPRHLRWPGFVVATLLFGVEHNLWLAGMIAGAVYAGLYRSSGQLWPAIISHAVTNGLLGMWIVVTGSWSYW